MPTIASMANRLDMTPQEAVETLRKLEYNIEGVDTEISDEQCDMLMDVDEDRSMIDTFLKEIQARRDKEQKAAEQRAKAAKKGAATRKKKATAKKKPAAKKKAAPVAEPVEILPHAEDVVEADDAKLKEAEPEEAPHLVADEGKAEILPPVEEQPDPPEEVAEVSVVPMVDEPDAVASDEIPDAEPPAVSPPAKKVLAEILPDEPEAPKDDTLPEETHIAEHHGNEGPLAEAQRRQEEADRRRKRQAEVDAEAASNPPLPAPDPEVVAAVIRRDQERRQPPPPPRPAQAAPARPGRAPRAGAAPAAPDRGRGPDAPLKELDDVAAERRRAVDARGKKPGASTGKTARKKAKRTRAVEDTLRRDAAVALREFQHGGSVGGTKKRRKKKRSEGDDTVEETQTGGTVEVEESMTVEHLAYAMEIGVNDIILQLMEDDIMANKNQVLDLETIRKVAAHFEYEVELSIPEEEEILSETADAAETLKFRPPVVTVMGHVDHGKTSFLDYVRKASVASGEAGGITQHIAAYEVELENGKVVFLDTPGHEAFTQMRARGSQVTDIVVLVVAADDGVKPQTIEAIDHAKAAEVPIVVAINKCDKDGAQPDRVRQELTKYELLDDTWGGKTVMREVSALTGDGISDLLEMIVLQSELMELTANPDKRARGTVLETELSRGQGPVAWVLVQSGTLRPGDTFLAGETYGRVRTMINPRGEQLESAGPSTPVLVTGFDEVGRAGDTFIVVEEERVARSIADKRATIAKHKSGPAVKHMTLEDFHARMLAEEQKELNLIIKADAQGSVSVIEQSFAKLGNQEVTVMTVHSGVGGINESDVMLASASDAVIIGFHVTASSKIQKLAEQEGVDIRLYRVIYEAIDDVKKALEGMLSPDKKEVVTGHAQIRQVFRSSAFGSIAGCMQLDGETERNSLARLIRDGVVVIETRIASVRRNKDEVKSVATGFECGIKLERFNDIREGDIIESYRIEDVAKKLE